MDPAVGLRQDAAVHGDRLLVVGPAFGLVVHDIHIIRVDLDTVSGSIHGDGNAAVSVLGAQCVDCERGAGISGGQSYAPDVEHACVLETQA